MRSSNAGHSRRFLVIGIAATLLVAVAGLLVLDAVRSDRVSEGVTVDGVDVGGMTSGEAEAVVRDQVARPLRQSVTAAYDGQSFELPPQRSRVRVDVEATVEQAVDRSRDGLPGVRALGDLLGLRTVSEDVEPRQRFSRRAVAAFSREIGDAIDREPADASMEPTASELITREASAGLEVMRPRLAARVARALKRPSQREVEVPVRTTPAEVTLADLAEEHPDYIIIDREGFTLRYYEDLELVEEYPISVGDVGHGTPSGEYDISTKAVNPTWYVPDSEWAGELAGEVIPPGPENPLKARWLGIYDGIGIHGTDEEWSIGQRASHGCIRMLVPDVEELYDRAPIGTTTYIA